MTIDWDFGDQKPMEPSSKFTKNADAAFDNFCKEYNMDPNIFLNTTKTFGESDKKRDAYKNPLYKDFYEKKEDKEKEFKKQTLNDIIEKCRKDFDNGNDHYSKAKNIFDKELDVQFGNSKGKISFMKNVPFNKIDHYSSMFDSLPTISKSRDDSVTTEHNNQKSLRNNSLPIKKANSDLLENKLGNRVLDERLIEYSRSNKSSKKRSSKENLRIRPRSVYNFDEINDGFVVKTYDQFKKELLKFSKVAAAKKQKNEQAVVENKKRSDIKKTSITDEMNNLKIEPPSDAFKTENIKKYSFEKKNKSAGSVYESLTQDDIYLTDALPQKKSFTKEFVKRYQSTKKKPDDIDQGIFNFKQDADYEQKASEPEKRLSLKVVACGMKKYGTLPIPKENYFIEKGDFGDDAGFWSETKDGCACGIADGATGNANYGYDPGDFSRNLMEQCSELFSKNGDITDSRDLLLKAYDVVQDKECYGSCTSCVIALDRRSNVLTAVNVGDSGYCLIRNGRIVHFSEPQRISYECPKQLDSYPWKEESRKMGVSYTEILGSDTMCDSIDVLKDDIIIISSDGLYDNLDYEEIEEICYKSKTMMDAVERIVYRTVKFNRKPDDILVLIARVIENTTITPRNTFSQA